MKIVILDSTGIMPGHIDYRPFGISVIPFGQGRAGFRFDLVFVLHKEGYPLGYGPQDPTKKNEWLIEWVQQTLHCVSHHGQVYYIDLDEGYRVGEYYPEAVRQLARNPALQTLLTSHLDAAG